MTPLRRFRAVFVVLAVLLFALPAGHGTRAEEAPAADVKDRVDAVQKRIAAEYDDLLALYKHLHSNPELSLHEINTGARLAKELKALGFDVTEKVGGTGVVGVFKNGDGPTVLVRTDMDALPVVEATDLPYASKVKVRDANDNEVGVMHACGHDMHMTCWVGTARVLTSLKDQWHGTLVFIGQPAEEVGLGAKAMLNDGLFQRFPKPDYCLALHCDAGRPYNTVGYTDGQALANVDSVDILVKGKGGHGAAPQTTVDPIVLSARIILDLQTLVSRETNPTDPAVVTVGSIHGGSKHNIIPSEVKMQLTVRSTKDSVRKHLLEGIQRIAKAAAEGAGAPEPLVTFDEQGFTPALVNESKLTQKTVAIFKEVFGGDRVQERGPVMGGEDFSRYGKDGTPIFLFWLGTVPPDRVAEAAKDETKMLPSLHSDQYHPTPEPSIKTGVLAMSLAVMNLMQKP
ncbi:MAG TPA: amidohydrolase [Gemmataceae bacterium]|nr:amidohydrolase [Gemmataceae bacterium]